MLFFCLGCHEVFLARYIEKMECGNACPVCGNDIIEISHEDAEELSLDDIEQYD